MSNDREQSYRQALDAIQEAQNLVNRACRALCSVSEPFTGDTAYSIACQLADKIKADWHRIEQRRQPVPRLAKKSGT